MAVFAANDVAETTAGALAARVIDWRDIDDQSAALGAERSEFQRAGRVPGPCNAPFETLSELSQAKSCPASLAPG